MVLSCHEDVLPADTWLKPDLQVVLDLEIIIANLRQRPDQSTPEQWRKHQHGLLVFASADSPRQFREVEAAPRAGALQVVSGLSPDAPCRLEPLTELKSDSGGTPSHLTQPDPDWTSALDF